MNLHFRQIELSDIEAIKSFTDKWIGKNYYSISDLEKSYHDSVYDNKSASYLALDNSKIVGVRITLAPGKLAQTKKGVTINSWKKSPDSVAYFKSLFIHKNYQQNGVGKTLSQLSINALKEMNAKAIVCHSWLESPNNSSQKYLQKMNFVEVNEHKNFWFDIDYLCSRCSPEKCTCTAIEMINYL